MAVKEVIENGKIFSREINWENRGYDSAAIVAPINIGEKEYICEVIVKQEKTQNSFYLHEVQLKEKVAGAFKTSTGEVAPATEPSLFKSILVENYFNIKNNVSKIIDKNGEPLVVYHGTNAKFNVFEHGDIGFHFGTKESAKSRDETLGLSAGTMNAMNALANEKDGIVMRGTQKVEYPFGRLGTKGMGFLHIVEQRVRKDGETLENAIDIAIKVAEAAAFGKETNKRYNQHFFDLGGIRAIVADKEDNSFVITGYEISADDSKVHKLPPQNLRSIPLGRKEEIVAALKNRLAQIEELRNSKFSLNMDAPRDLFYDPMRQIYDKARHDKFVKDKTNEELEALNTAATNYDSLLKIAQQAITLACWQVRNKRDNAPNWVINRLTKHLNDAERAIAVERAQMTYEIIKNRYGEIPNLSAENAIAAVNCDKSKHKS